MRSLVAAYLLIVTAAALPAPAQVPSGPPPEEKPAAAPQMHDTQRISLCMAKAKKPLEPSDVAPVLFGREGPKIIHRPWPQSRRGQEGRVILRVIIDEDGCVREVKILESAKKKLDAAAVEAVKQWVYLPTYVDGKPVRALHTVVFNFHGR